MAPDALCFADHPACGAAPCCAAGSRASSGPEPCDVLNKYASGPVPRCRGMVARWHDHLHDLATASRA